MARRNLGRTPEGAVIYYFDTKAEMDAMTDVIDATAQAWLPDGSKYRASGVGGWHQTHSASAVLVSDGISGTPDTRIAGSCATRERITFIPAKKYICITPRPAKSVDYTVTGTAAALGTTGVISNYTNGTLVISGLTAETINVTALIGSAQTLETAAIRVIDLTTGAVTAASALGNGSYKLVDLVGHKLKFTKSAAVESATVTLTVSLPTATASVRAVRNAASTGTADDILAQADTKDFNMIFDVVQSGDPIEKQEFYDPDGISTVDLLVDAGTLTQVEVTGVDSV